MKQYVFSLIISSTIPLQTLPSYHPIRYEQFLAQSSAALEAQRKLIEQKLYDLTARRTRTLGMNRDSHLTRRKDRIKDELLLATDITFHTLEARLAGIKERVLALKEEKMKLATLQIADRNAETELLRKASARETISDIQDQLKDITTMESYFLQMPSGEIDPNALRELRNKWSKQRIELTSRLSREQAAAR